MTLRTWAGDSSPPRAAADVPPPPRGRQGPARPPRRGGYLPYLVPGVLLFVAVIAVPLVMNVGISFTRWQGVGGPEWAGLDQYRKLFTDTTFWVSTRNNLALVFAMAVVPTFLGLLLATALFDVVAKRFGDRTTSALRASFYLPQVLPAVVAGSVWGWILHPEYGSTNALLRFVGLESWTPSAGCWSRRPARRSPSDFPTGVLMRTRTLRLVVTAVTAVLAAAVVAPLDAAARYAPRRRPCSRRPSASGRRGTSTSSSGSAPPSATRPAATTRPTPWCGA